MFGELQTKHCIVLLVVLAFCAVSLTVFPLVFSDDGSTAHAKRQNHELHKQMVQATMNFRAARAHGLSSRIPVVTVDTHNDDAFIKMDGAEGITMCNVGVHGEWRSMLTKNEMLLDWLEDQLPNYKEELVIVVDAHDMMYGGCAMDKLLSAYKSIYTATGAPVIVSAGMGLFPKDEKYTTQRYAELRKRRQLVMKAAGLPEDVWRRQSNVSRPKCASANASSCSEATDYEFMNYGFLLGTVGALHGLVSYVVQTVPPGLLDSMRGFLAPAQRVEEASDQGVAAMYMFDHPGEVTLDYSMSLVATLHDMPRELLEFKNGQVWNNVTKHEQCFMHFNGNSREHVKYVREHLAASRISSEDHGSTKVKSDLPGMIAQ